MNEYASKNQSTPTPEGQAHISGLNWLKLLDRIGVEESEPDHSTLSQLQYRALLTLTFENIDIHLGRPILLNYDAVYAKIVTGDRGGFCYELKRYPQTDGRSWFRVDNGGITCNCPSLARPEAGRRCSL